MTQREVARLLRVTQAYVSLLERGRRPVPKQLARAAVLLLGGPATALPVELPPGPVSATSDRAVEELARLGYPGFAYLGGERATQNPATLLLSALGQDELEVRVAEALPWLLLEFDRLDVDLVVREAKLHDLQNRLGFVVTLAREVAEVDPASRHRMEGLRELERRLESSKLAREVTFGGRMRSERMQDWVRARRSDAAKRWNVLSDLRREHLPYVGQGTRAVAELPSRG